MLLIDLLRGRDLRSHPSLVDVRVPIDHGPRLDPDGVRLDSNELEYSAHLVRRKRMPKIVPLLVALPDIEPSGDWFVENDRRGLHD